MDSTSEEKTQQTVKVVVFLLDNEEYAASIDSVKEVINVTDITSIPDSPEYILGIINLRGMVVPILDLEKKLNLKREGKTSYKHILVAEDNQNHPFGLEVDQVKEVLTVLENKIQPVSKILTAKIPAEFLKGVVVITADEGDPSYQSAIEASQRAKNSRILLLLDLKKILSTSANFPQLAKPSENLDKISYNDTTA